MTSPSETPAGRLVAVDIDAPPAAAAASFFSDERAVAIRDLLSENVFRPVGHAGAFRLSLSVSEGRLRLDIADQDGQAVARQTVSLTPLRRVVKDYFLICDSYRKAKRAAQRAQIEAIDMGRRGLHDQGAEILREQLEGKVEIDFPTSRRLFTLVCSLRLQG